MNADTGELLSMVADRIGQVAPMDIQSKVLEYRTCLAKSLRSIVGSEKEADLATLNEAKKVLICLRGCLEQFGAEAQQNDWIVEAFHGAHWDLRRAFDRDVTWRNHLRRAPLSELVLNSTEDCRVLFQLLDELQPTAIRKETPTAIRKKTVSRLQATYAQRHRPAAMHDDIGVDAALTDPDQRNILARLREDLDSDKAQTDAHHGEDAEYGERGHGNEDR